MEKICALLVILSFWVVGCTGLALQPAALAYNENPTRTAIPTSTTPAAPPSPTPALSTATAPARTATPVPSATTAPARYIFGPDAFPKDINPLTGLPVLDEEILDRRPIVIKVTNFPRSVRPQWGLSLADHVYEYYIGDNMSRFVGVFYGRDASRVGPIRSARLFDEHIMRMYNGIFIFGWADDPILEFLLAPDIRSYLVVERPDNCPPLCRMGSDATYNNLFADTAQIGPYLKSRGTSSKRQHLDGLQFDLIPPKSGNPGTKFYLRYSIVSYHYWEYDPATGRYYRFQDDKDQVNGSGEHYAPLTDSLTNVQLSADNVIILRVPHQVYLRSNSTEILDQLVNGKGSGFAFRNGQVYPISWYHDSPNRLIKLQLPNGITYSLKPGTVWYEIIGETSTFEPGEAGEYKLTFSMP
jgi:hypothetical protein